MTKNIWIINQYASTPETGIGGRHHYLSRELGKLGYRVHLIAARWHHLLNDEDAAMAAPDVEERDHYTFVRISMPKYKSAHDPKRAINWHLFAWHINRLQKRIAGKPETIIYSSPSLPGYLGAERLARKTGAKLIFEVRDIWPLSLIEVGGKSPSHPFVKWLQFIENRAYRKSDIVASNLALSVNHMVEHGLERDKFVWLPNGFSHDEVLAKEPLSKLLEDQFPKDKFVVGYVGTIGRANNLGALLDAAKLIADNKNISFVIIGRGLEAQVIEERIQRECLNNVKLLGAIPKIQVQSALEKLDACYIGLMPEPLFRFGVSPNKLFDYLIAGKPVLYAIDSGKYQPVADANAGFHLAPNDASALAHAISTLCNMSKSERQAMGEKGRNAALEHYDYAKIAERLSKVL